MSEITLESIAKHCIDGNITGPQIAYLLAIQAELKRLRNENIQIHTMVKCVNCERGVQPRNTIRGYCPICAEELLDVTDKLLTERDRVLDAIPECPMHGPQCVPHALEWIEETQAELERLRGIEKAVMSLSLIEGITIGLDGVIAMWQLMERDAPPMYARVCKAIVNALETK